MIDTCSWTSCNPGPFRLRIPWEPWGFRLQHLPVNWTHFLLLWALRFSPMRRELPTPSLIFSQVPARLEPEPSVVHAARGQRDRRLPSYSCPLPKWDCCTLDLPAGEDRKVAIGQWMDLGLSALTSHFRCSAVAFGRGCCNLIQVQPPSATLPLSQLPRRLTAVTAVFWPQGLWWTTSSETTRCTRVAVGPTLDLVMPHRGPNRDIGPNGVQAKNCLRLPRAGSSC